MVPPLGVHRLTKPFLGTGLAAGVGSRAGTHKWTPLYPGGGPWSAQWPWGAPQARPKEPVCGNARDFPTSPLPPAPEPHGPHPVSALRIQPQRTFRKFFSSVLEVKLLYGTPSTQHQ